MNGIEPGGTVHHVAGTFPEWFDDVLSYIIPTAVFFAVLLSTLVTTDTILRLCTVDPGAATTPEYNTPFCVWLGILAILLGLVLLDVVGQTVCNIAHSVIKNWILVPILKRRYYLRAKKLVELLEQLEEPAETDDERERWEKDLKDAKRMEGIEQSPQCLARILDCLVCIGDEIVAGIQWCLHGRSLEPVDVVNETRKSLAEIDITFLRYEDLPGPYDISNDFGEKMKKAMDDGVMKLHFRLLILGYLREFCPRLAGYLSKKFARARAARSMAFYWLLLFWLLVLFSIWSPASVERSLLGAQLGWFWLLFGSAALFILYFYIYYRRQYWFGRYVLMSYMGAKQGTGRLGMGSDAHKQDTSPSSPTAPTTDSED